MLYNAIKNIKVKISCLLILVVFTFCMFNSCEEINTVKNSGSIKSEVFETSPSNTTSIKDKTAIGNKNDEPLHPSPLKSPESAKMNNGAPLLNNSHASRENPPEISSYWQIYRYLEYGYEVSYPPDYNPSISGGHSVTANPEFGMRLSLYSKDNQPAVDIDTIKIDTFHNVDNFIKSKYRDEMTSDGGFSINHENHNIYCINGDDYYFVFFSNKSYIFQLSSSSKELLTKIARAFVLI